MDLSGRNLISRQASKSSLFRLSGSGAIAASKGAVARSRARRTTSSKSNFAGAGGCIGCAVADAASFKGAVTALEMTRHLTSVRRFRLVIGGLDLRGRRVRGGKLGGQLDFDGVMTFLDAGKADTKHGISSQKPGDALRALAERGPRRAERGRRSREYFLKKVLVFRANRPISALAQFRTCLWSCVGWRGSGQEAG